MTRILILFFLTIGLFGCKNKNQNRPSNLGDTIILTMFHDDPDLPDTFKRQGAIFISPTDQKLFQLARTDSVKFYAVADKRKLARLYIDSLEIEHYEKLAIGTILIKQKNGVVLEVNLDNVQWGIILFNGKDLPVLADINSFETYFNQYMGN